MTPEGLGGLAAPLGRLAVLMRLQRRDGVALHFTAHDRDLLVDGMTWRSRPGLVPSAVMVTAEWNGDRIEVAGTTSPDGVRADDLSVGRWTDGRFDLALCHWDRPDWGLLPIVSGVMRGVLQRGAGGAQFVLTLAGDLSALSDRGGQRCSPGCRASLGDADCGVDLEKYRVEALVAESGVDWVRLAPPIVDAVPYAAGQLRIMSGRLSGVDRRVAAAEDGRLFLEPETGLALEAGTRVLVTQGCDKRFETCRGRFDNALRFMGEPHVPGADALTRYVPG